MSAVVEPSVGLLHAAHEYLLAWSGESGSERPRARPPAEHRFLTAGPGNKQSRNEYCVCPRVRRVGGWLDVGLGARVCTCSNHARAYGSCTRQRGRFLLSKTHCFELLMLPL